MRKTILLLMLVLFCFTPMAMAEQTPPQTIDEALAVANDEVRVKNRGGDYFRTTNTNSKLINNSLWESRRLFVFGQPYGMDQATGNNRYLGETMQGEAYTNTLFRHDAWEGGVINERKWIPYPWSNDIVKAHLLRMGEQPLDKNNPFNNNRDYNASIKQGLKEYFKPGGNVQMYFRDDSTPWHQFLHVLQPPTRWTWGMGRMWHQSNGTIWYLTVPMAPFSLITELPNLAIGDINPGFEGEVTAGTKCTGWFEVINESPQSFEDVPVGLWHNGWKAKTKNAAGTVIETIDIEPNETVKVYFECTTQEGKSTLVAKVDKNPLQETIEETTKEDNTGEIEVLPKAPPAPPSNGALTFQARNQGGKDLYGKYIPPTNRTANTAMWEDMVTATLKPPAPTPPKGTLKSWSITSATITIPKQHPRFSFGTPYPPVSTETLTMKPGGHTATSIFKETWGIDGFNRGGSPGVYSPIEKRVMAAKPKSYNISANYSIRYTYEWQEKRRSCSTGSNGKRKCRTYYVTKSATGTTSGTATGSLLVNGAGRIPF